MNPVRAKHSSVRRRIRKSGAPQTSEELVVSASTASAAPVTARVLMLQRTIGNYATRQVIQRDTWRERRRARKQARNNAKLDDLRDKELTATHPWNQAKKKDEDSDWGDTKGEKIIEGTELVASFKDELSMALSNFSAENRTLSFDGIYHDWLREQGLPQNTSLYSLDDDQADSLKKKEIDEGGLSVISKDSDQRTNLGIGSGAAGTLALGAGSFASFVAMVGTIVKLYNSY
jgi:hypothetical protein